MHKFDIFFACEIAATHFFLKLQLPSFPAHQPVSAIFCTISNFFKVRPLFFFSKLKHCWYTCYPAKEVVTEVKQSHLACAYTHQFCMTELVSLVDSFSWFHSTNAGLSTFELWKVTAVGDWGCFLFTPRAIFTLQLRVTWIRFFCSYVTKIWFAFDSVNSTSRIESDIFKSESGHF